MSELEICHWGFPFTLPFFVFQGRCELAGWSPSQEESQIQKHTQQLPPCPPSPSQPDFGFGTVESEVDAKSCCNKVPPKCLITAFYLLTDAWISQSGIHSLNQHSDRRWGWKSINPPRKYNNNKKKMSEQSVQFPEYETIKCCEFTFIKHITLTLIMAGNFYGPVFIGLVWYSYKHNDGKWEDDWKTGWGEQMDPTKREGTTQA